MIEIKILAESKAAEEKARYLVVGIENVIAANKKSSHLYITLYRMS
jgi:hypothetical protein